MNNSNDRSLIEKNAPGDTTRIFNEGNDDTKIMFSPNQDNHSSKEEEKDYNGSSPTKP